MKNQYRERDDVVRVVFQQIVEFERNQEEDPVRKVFRKYEERRRARTLKTLLTICCGLLASNLAVWVVMALESCKIVWRQV